MLVKHPAWGPARLTFVQYLHGGGDSDLAIGKPLGTAMSSACLPVCFVPGTTKLSSVFNSKPLIKGER